MNTTNQEVISPAFTRLAMWSLIDGLIIWVVTGSLATLAAVFGSFWIQPPQTSGVRELGWDFFAWIAVVMAIASSFGILWPLAVWLRYRRIVREIPSGKSLVDA
jgi:hypothetical protein